MPDVEFLDDAGALVPDEEELAVGRSWARAGVVLWLVAGVSVVVALAVTIGRTAPDPTPPPRSSAVAVPIDLPRRDVMGPEADPVQGDRDSCPKRVLCSTVQDLPNPTLRALAHWLPNYQIDGVRSIHYVSPVQNRNVVWFRDIAVFVGKARVVVLVLQPRTGDQDSTEVAEIRGLRSVRIQRTFADRTVVVRLTGGEGPSVTQLRRLAADVRLLAV